MVLYKKCYVFCSLVEIYNIIEIKAASLDKRTKRAMTANLAMTNNMFVSLCGCV